MLDWEYVREILRVDLRARLAEQDQAWPDHTLSSPEGPIPQDSGASYAQIVPPEPQAPGGDRHV
jgi:hypothetical protein